MMNTFVTHPSVRIKGTENNYDPVQCMDTGCSTKTLHMHCPFCVKTDSFIDPVILRAHYRVKHVDKGIEFAGLKILRCCDHCDIVGAIKGAKEFKGAHWHCYRCRNGFNRRDEAIKHYGTHFRNPQTTFQIQVTQEVNQGAGLAGAFDGSIGGETIVSDDLVTIHPALTEAVMTKSPADTLAANETVATTENQTIMIIQEDQLDNGVISIESSEVTEDNMSDIMIQNLQKTIKTLSAEKSKQHKQLTNEINNLRVQVESQAAEIERLQKREQELVAQLSVPLDDRIQELLQSLKTQHEDLLHQQLAQLRRSYIHSYFVISKDSELEDYPSQNIVMISGEDAAVTTSMQVTHNSDPIIDVRPMSSNKTISDHELAMVDSRPEEQLTGQVIQIQVSSPAPETSPTEHALEETPELDLVLVCNNEPDMDTHESADSIEDNASLLQDHEVASPPSKRKKS